MNSVPAIPSDATNAARTPPRSQAIVWRVHPARERPVAAGVTLAVTAAFGIVAASLMQDPWWGVFSAAGLLIALHRFFLPNRFEIDADGVSASTPLFHRRLAWREVRHFEHDLQRAFLSSRSQRSLLDGSRGVPLLFDGNAADVVRRIKLQLSTTHRSPLTTHLLDDAKTNDHHYAPDGGSPCSG